MSTSAAVRISAAALATVAVLTSAAATPANAAATTAREMPGGTSYWNSHTTTKWGTGWRAYDNLTLVRRTGTKAVAVSVSLYGRRQAMGGDTCFVGTHTPTPFMYQGIQQWPGGKPFRLTRGFKSVNDQLITNRNGFPGQPFSWSRPAGTGLTIQTFNQLLRTHGFTSVADFDQWLKRDLISQQGTYCLA